MVDIPIPEERQERILAALLHSKTRVEAAKMIGVTEKTLRRYLQDPILKARYARARHDILEEVLSILQLNMRYAVSALVDIAVSPSANEHARVAAARATLEYGIKMTELVDIEERLRALEEERPG